MACGWFVLYVDTDRNKGGLNFQLWPVSSVYCDSNRADGRIDIVYREFELTAEQIINEYSEANLSIDFKDNASRDPSKKFEVVHAIYPRDDGKQGEQAKHMPIASVHVLQGENNLILKESGYHKIPVVVPRWMQITLTSLSKTLTQKSFWKKHRKQA